MDLIVWALAIMAVSDALRAFLPKLPPWTGWAFALTLGVAVALYYEADIVTGLAAAGLSAVFRAVTTAVAEWGDLAAAKALATRLGRSR